MVLSTLLEAGREIALSENAPRLRFVDCRLERSRAAVSTVTVELDGPQVGQRTQMIAEGTTCPGGDLRLAAQATLDALVKITNGALSVDLIGVKPMRAFDTNIVVVAVVTRVNGESRKLVGAAIIDDDSITGAALAALHALNRVVAPLIGSASTEPVVQANEAPMAAPTIPFPNGGIAPVPAAPVAAPSGSILGVLPRTRIGAYMRRA